MVPQSLCQLLKIRLGLLMSFAYSGLLLMNKPSGPTSHDVVADVRRALNTREVGHTGTLDPFASGLMVLVLGEATKLSSYITEGDKAYIATLFLGATTPTQDRTSPPVSQYDGKPLEMDQVRCGLESTAQQTDFVVPPYSAVKVNGRKLYERARNNEEVPVVIRPMNFYGVEILSYSWPSLKVSVKCSKGGYIRAWASRLGELLGTGAYLQELERTQVAPFSIDQSVSLDRLKELGGQKAYTDFCEAWVPVDKALFNWPSVFVAPELERLARNGAIPHVLEPQMHFALTRVPSAKGVQLVSRDTGRLISIALRENEGFRIGRVFN